jgi:hypothetical protein
LFAEKVGSAKASVGGNYGKEGRHFVIINSGKQDSHASKNYEQVIFEGMVVHILDPGPPAGQRFVTSKGGNETPHSVLDPFTFYFGATSPGAEGRCVRFLLVAADMEESKVPPSINPATGQPCAVPSGTSIDPATGNPVNPGTLGSVLSVKAMTHFLNMATNPSVNALRNVVLEVVGRGTTTQGRGSGGTPQKIIAIDPVRRVYPSQLHTMWAQIDPKAQAELQRDGRWQLMIAQEEKQRAHMAGVKT